MENNIVAELLNLAGYKIMAIHARSEKNKEILKGYLYLIRYKAVNSGDINLFKISNLVLKTKFNNNGYLP